MLLTVISLAALCRDPKPGIKDISLYVTGPCLTIQPIYSEKTFLICPYIEKIIFNRFKADMILLYLYILDIFPAKL